MITVSDTFKEAWLNGRQKYIELDFSDNTTLGDDDVVLESLNLTQELCGESQLVFGLTSSACFTIEIFNANKQYLGLEVTPIVAAIDDDSQYQLMSLGTYTIKEDTRSEDRTYRTLVAYDALYDVLNTDYSEFYNDFFDNNASPTFKDFRDAFFSEIGITQESVTLLTDTIKIIYKPETTSISGSDIIQAICEPSAAFGFINYDGNFQYVLYDGRNMRHYPSDTLYPSNLLFPADGADELILQSDNADAQATSVVFSDYYTHKITQVRYNATAYTDVVDVGTEGNRYELKENVLLYSQTETVLTSILTKFYEKVKDIFYNPASIQARARLWLQLGDVIDVATSSGGVHVPIMQRTIEGLTAMQDTYEIQGQEYYVYSPNSQSNIVGDFENYVANNRVELKKLEDSIYSSVGKAIDVWDEGELDISIHGFEVPTVTESGTITWDMGEDSYDQETYGEPVLENYTMDDNGKTSFDLYNGDAYVLHLTPSGIGTSQTVIRKEWVFQTDINYPGYADGDYTYSDVGMLCLNEETGKVYELQSYTETVGKHSGYLHTVYHVRWVQTQQLTTTKAEMYTSITQNAEAITAEATRATSSENSLSSRITQNATSISSEVTRATTKEGQLSSRIEQTATSISFSLSKSGDSTTVLSMSYTKEDGTTVSVSSQSITFNGLVSFTDLSTSGSTTINGSNITTGTINASLITSGTLSANRISGGTLSSASISGGTISGAVISGATISSATFTGDEVSIYELHTTVLQNEQTLSSNAIETSTINDVDVSSHIITGVTRGSDESGTGSKMVHSLGYANRYTIGYYMMTINTSDRRLKVDVKPLDDFTEIYMRLKPCEYRYNHSLKGYVNRDKVHYGLIAQDVAELYDEYGKDKFDNAFIFKQEEIDPEEQDLIGNDTWYWSMEKDELHAMHVQMIQKQQKRIEKLETEVSELKALVQQLLVKESDK